MIDIDEARSAHNGGLAFVCAMCENYWESQSSKAQKLSGSGKCGQSECGGPMAGLAYPSYKGPFPDNDWSRFCFVCGCPHGLDVVKVVGVLRPLAVCDQHREMVDTLHPEYSGLEIQRDHKVLIISRKVGGDTRQAGQAD